MANKHNAVKSLWGAGNAEAINKIRTRECVAHPGTREQTVLTPQVVVDALAKLWPEGIALDPCSCTHSLVPAKRKVILPENGLEVSWRDFTYVNPPYSHLKHWLAKATDEVELAGGRLELVLLIPVRTHRKWWRQHILQAGHQVCWLNPLKFHGFPQAFPAPLCLVYYGRRNNEFATAFNRLGTSF